MLKIFLKKIDNKRRSLTRVAELGSLSSGAKMAMKIFVRHVFTKISKKCVNHDKS